MYIDPEVEERGGSKEGKRKDLATKRQGKVESKSRKVKGEKRSVNRSQQSNSSTNRRPFMRSGTQTVCASQ